MIMKALIVLAGTLLLVGCVSRSAMLVNKDGKTVTCSASGWGYVGAPVAMHRQKKCLEAAHAAGYHEPTPP